MIRLTVRALDFVLAAAAGSGLPVGRWMKRKWQMVKSSPLWRVKADEEDFLHGVISFPLINAINIFHRTSKTWLCCTSHVSQKRDGGMSRAEVWTGVYFNRDGTVVVQSDTHPSTLLQDEVFGRPIKMKNAFARHPSTSCLLMSFTSWLHVLILYFFNVLSFSWRQHVLHLHNRLSLRRSGHLRSSCADIPDGSRLVRPRISLYHVHS